ncbi:MAG: hypothetical protein KGH84_03525 [Paracoccaceae bacterium]|nr:hypothetical protein [Paracoccaceae bacterium]
MKPNRKNQRHLGANALPHGKGRLWLALSVVTMAGAYLAYAASSDAQAQDRADNVPKSILDLQPFRQTTTATLASGETLRFVSLNSNSNAWFILFVSQANGNTASFHVENPYPTRQSVALLSGPNPSLNVTWGQQHVACAPWVGTPSPLSVARSSGTPFVALCEGHLMLRNRVKGATTNLEWAASFLRNNIWGGDALVGIVKDTLYKDAFSETARVISPGTVVPDNVTPMPGLDPAASAHPFVHAKTGLTLTGVTNGRMALGIWYPITAMPGVSASTMAPAALDRSVLDGPGITNPLDPVERHSLDYFVAFDLSRFDLGYAMGTQYPGLGWSPRPPASVRDMSLPGPDGIGSPAPLVPLGMVNPTLKADLVATFTAGFKRRHGAFKVGPLSRVNHGSHYGFIEQGVVMSTLQPGLSTLYVLDDGTIGMKTWTEGDRVLLPKIRFARQNGVPLLERAAAGGTGVPGNLVTSAEGGNWSGAADLSLRTLRAGSCLKQTGAKQYLIFGYFSTATPSAMARTFAGYGCTYAMLLDMNALVHTYLALYPQGGRQSQIEHLVPGMAAVDKKGPTGQPLARFVDYPDNRDFFYLTRKP